MAGSINKVILVGNLGNEPEIRQTQNGKEIAHFSVATSENWKDKDTGERREKTEWHRVVVFNDGLVRVVKNYLHKGSKIYLEGALQTRKWQDNTGQDKYTTEIVLQGYGCNLTMLDSKAAAQGYADNDAGYNQQSTAPTFGQTAAASAPQQAAAIEQELDDDIPF